MATLLEFDLVLYTTLPTNYTAVMKVENVLDCAHECMRQSTCEAMAFSILTLVCVLYQESIQEDTLAPANMEMLAYNLQRAGSCNGSVGSIPGPAYPACPLGSGFSYELAINVCYKWVTYGNEAGKATCVQEGGSDLLKIDTQEKLDFFKLVSIFRYAYIQGDRIPSTGEWVYWEEGTTRPMPFIDWAPGQPNGATVGQDCMAMDAAGQHDIPCYWSGFASLSLCEYDME